MTSLWAVARVEMVISLRRPVWWVVAGLMALLGWAAAAEVRLAPLFQWNNLGDIAVVVTLLLAVTTGDQIARDRVCRADGVIKTAPVSTGSYVCGKYIAALAVLLGASGLWLASALVLDSVAPRFPSGLGPPVGPQPYLVGWLWFVVVPLVFGAALGLAGVTLARGQRLLVVAALVVIWWAPFFVAAPAHGDVLSDLLDVTLLRSSSFSLITPALLGEHAPPNMDLLLGPHLRVLVPQTSGETYLHYLPPLPLVSVGNRLLFLGLAVLLVGLTTWLVGKQRQEAA